MLERNTLGLKEKEIIIRSSDISKTDKRTLGEVYTKHSHAQVTITTMCTLQHHQQQRLSSLST